jgi:hypothetical protein
MNTATPGQLKLIGIGLRNAGVNNRAERVHLISSYIGRPIDTSSQLTRHEAAELINRLRGTERLTRRTMQ